MQLFDAKDVNYVFGACMRFWVSDRLA